MNNTAALSDLKFQLQQQVLDSWTRLHNAQAAHNHLLAQLQSVREQLAAPGDLFTELFAELDSQHRQS